jgi:hypothetical protein
MEFLSVVCWGVAYPSGAALVIYYIDRVLAFNANTGLTNIRLG